MKEGEGLIINIKEHSNSSYIIKLLTEEGKVSGFLKGGLKRKEKISTFTLVKFKLTRRLEEHLGTLKLEVVEKLEWEKILIFFHIYEKKIN